MALDCRVAALACAKRGSVRDARRRRAGKGGARGAAAGWPGRRNPGGAGCVAKGVAEPHLPKAPRGRLGGPTGCLAGCKRLISNWAVAVRVQDGGSSRETRLAKSSDHAYAKAPGWEDSAPNVFFCPTFTVQPDVPPATRPDVGKSALVESPRDILPPRPAAEPAQSLHKSKARPPLERHGFQEKQRFSATRTRRIGTAARFADRLRERGILREDDVLDEFFVAHRIQKYAYIASMLGARLDYKFRFLECGAHSGELALDLHSHRHGRGGDDPFEENPAALDALVGIVHGRRDTRWLQMATFAIRDLRMGESRDEFVRRMLDGRLEYTKRAAVDAFERVRSHIRDLEAALQ